jgi:hypothetical protein
LSAGKRQVRRLTPRDKRCFYAKSDLADLTQINPPGHGQRQKERTELPLIKADDRQRRRLMRHLPTIAFAIAAVIAPAAAEDIVPYAYRPPTAGPIYVPGLGDIMSTIQWRHLKLSYAGQLRNWELASYELGQIRESLSNAARLYQNIPIEKITMVEQPLVALSDAITTKNSSHFTKAFADLTKACNSCHAAANVGFIVIQVPTVSPFSNQSFKRTAK